MPELPEVETTRRGIAPYVEGEQVTEVIVRQPRLRVPVPEDLAERLVGETVGSLRRRAKYLLMPFQGNPSDALIWHLGMSGSLRLVPLGELPRKHDHLDLVLSNGHVLRYHDPRRFGLVDWLTNPEQQDPRLSRLGPEPLGPQFTGSYLYRCSRGRRVAVKPFLMDNPIVVGVGNIYATEALFMAGIDPRRAAGKVSLVRYRALAAAVREVLGAAIEQGGTTLRDFVSASGEPGYFAQQLHAYGRHGQPCQRCGSELKQASLGQRASTFCPACQT